MTRSHDWSLQIIETCHSRWSSLKHFSIFLILALLPLLVSCGGVAPATGWSRPAFAQNTLYVGSTGGKVYALDPANGNKKWTSPADNTRLAVLYSAPVVDGDLVYIG